MVSTMLAQSAEKSCAYEKNCRNICIVREKPLSLQRSFPVVPEVIQTIGCFLPISQAFLSRIFILSGDYFAICILITIFAAETNLSADRKT